jgi:hypothetical protein
VVPGAGAPSTPICTVPESPEPSEPPEPLDDEPDPDPLAEVPAEAAVDSRATGSEKLVTALEAIGAPRATPATAPATRRRESTRRSPTVRRRRRCHWASAEDCREGGGWSADMWCTR